MPEDDLIPISENSLDDRAALMRIVEGDGVIQPKTGQKLLDLLRPFTCYETEVIRNDEHIGAGKGSVPQKKEVFVVEEFNRRSQMLFDLFGPIRIVVTSDDCSHVAKLPDGESDRVFDARF